MRPTTSEWWASAHNGGWVTVRRGHDNAAREVLVRVEPDSGGRLRIVDLFLSDDEGITARSLLSLRLGAIEDLLNLPEIHDDITRRLDLVVRVDLRKAAKDVPKGLGSQRRARRVQQRQRQPLVVPEARRYGPSFYANVAAAYSEAVRRREPPLVAIAKEANVPHTTAARWVRRAKELGYLQ